MPPLESESFTIATVRLFEYALPFKTPLLVGDQRLTHRRGLIIEVTDTAGERGYGETAPLPGYSRETLTEARLQLQQLAEQLGGKQMSLAEFASYRGAFYPSVVFGVETAFFQIQHSTKSKKKGVRVNGLLFPQRERLETQVAELLAMGFETIKIKVARLAMGEEISVIKRVSALLPAGITLRLDANGLWDFQSAVSFGLGIEGTAIEYIEEPCQDSAGFEEFHRRTGLPVALDESLMDLTYQDFIFPAGVVALVLKPTTLGGIGRTGQFIQIARQKGLKPVISSCFEAGPGFAQLLDLATDINFDHSASGLDTMKYFAQDLFVHPLVMERGTIHWWENHELNQAEAWRMELLTEIPSGE